MKFNNEVYNILKWIAQIVLPAMGALYYGLAAIWGFPYGEQVVGTITVIDAFLGALLGISSAGYEGDGTLHVDTSMPDKDRYNLALDIPLEELPNRKDVMLKVSKK